MTTTTYKLTDNTLEEIKAHRAELRKAGGDKNLAKKIQTVIGLLKKKTFTDCTNIAMIEAYTGKQTKEVVTEVIDYLFENIEMECEKVVESEISNEAKQAVEETEEVELIQTEEIQVPEIEIDNSYQSRYDFINELEYSEMTAHQLSMVLFKELGHELESKIVSMATGSIVKTRALDELKDLLVETYPNIRVEELEAKLANALAITKQKHDKSTAMLDGNLLVYKYLGTEEKASEDELKNFSFMAKIGGDRHSLDTVILQSAFSTYKDEVAQGNLPITSNELNVAIISMINKIKPATEENKKAIQNLF